MKKMKQTKQSKSWIELRAGFKTHFRTHLIITPIMSFAMMLIIALFSNVQIYAQQIAGKLTNSRGESIELANVLLYRSADSTFVTGTITNQNGEFVFKNIVPKKNYLKVSCMGYYDAIYSDVVGRHVNYVLRENTQTLEEVTVTANKPIVRIREGALAFEVATLIKHRPINNAFDILGEIPGVEKMGNKIQIIGANSTTIIINNRVSSMTADQLIDYLKNIPPERVKQVELLYVTPPQYGVNGSSINLVIANDRSPVKKQKAQITLEGNQSYYFSPSASVSYSLANAHSSLNVLYSFRYDHEHPSEQMESFHQLGDDQHRVSFENATKGIYKAHHVGVSYDYDFKNKDVLSLSYNGTINRSDARRSGLIVIDEDRKISSANKSEGPSDLHHISLDYTHRNLHLGANYSFYNNKKDQFLVNTLEPTSSGILLSEVASGQITSNSKQLVHQGYVYMSNQHSLRGKQVFSYGVNARINRSNNDQSTWADESLEGGFSQKHSEYAVDGFVGWSQNLGKKVSVNANLSLEYYRAKIKAGTVEQTLWKNWEVYPTLTLVYKIAPMKTLQFSLLSERKYPSYWQTTPNVTYLNDYVASKGNPKIKPAKIYSGRLSFILKGRYIFQLFGNLSSDYIQQSLYQSPESLHATYKIINLDKHNIVGGLVVLPFKVGQRLESKLMVSGFLIHDKGALEEVAFDRKKIFGRISMNNNLYLTAKKDLSVQLNGFYATPAIQGIYDIKPMYNLSLGMVWEANKRLNVSLTSDDLLNGRKGRTTTKIQSQNYNQTIHTDSRQIVLTVRYNIGGYKEKESSKIDTSRFGL